MSLLELAKQLEDTAEVIRTPSATATWSGAWARVIRWSCCMAGLGPGTTGSKISVSLQHYRLIVADIPGLGDPMTRRFNSTPGITRPVS